MTVHSWPMTPLGDVLEKNEESVGINATTRYQQVTVRLWGKGVVPRGEVAGIELAGARRSLVRAGQFILSRIDARHGAFGIVPEELDGAVATNDFPSFNIIENRLTPDFLGWLSRTDKFIQLCRAASEGTTNRVRLKEEKFLKMFIPLPDKNEQNRIAQKLNTIASRMEEAKTLHNQIKKEVNLLPVAMVHRTDLSKTEKARTGWQEVQLSSVITPVSEDVPVEVSKEYPNFGIYSFGRGLFAKPPISGLETSATKLRRVRAGQFIYSRLFAWEGAYGVVTPEFDSWFVSNEYPTFECNTSRILPEVLFAYFQADHVWNEVAAGSRGLGSRRLRVQPDRVLEYRATIPPIEVQHTIRDVMNRGFSLSMLSGEQSKELESMFPSILDRAFSAQL